MTLGIGFSQREGQRVGTFRPGRVVQIRYLDEGRHYPGNDGSSVGENKA